MRTAGVEVAHQVSVERPIARCDHLPAGLQLPVQLGELVERHLWAHMVFGVVGHVPHQPAHPAVGKRGACVRFRIRAFLATRMFGQQEEA